MHRKMKLHTYFGLGAGVKSFSASYVQLLLVSTAGACRRMRSGYILIGGGTAFLREF